MREEFGGNTPKKRYHLVYLVVDARIILKRILNVMGRCGIGNLVQDSDKLRAVLKNVMDL